MENNRDKEFDFFISHASEDKDEFVRPFALKLIDLGYKVWYDEYSLKIGDSLLSGISKGIRNSKYGIIVLSKNFFKKTWTKKELEALLTKETLFNNNIILPLWLDITINDVYDFSPLITDKLAIRATTKEIDNIISQIEKKTKLNIISKEVLIEKINSIKNLTEDRRKKYFLDLESRIKNLFHFQQEYYNWYTSDDAFGDKDWDDLLVEEKRIELQKEYNIPDGVWDNTELRVGPKMQILIRLGKKWVYRKMSHLEAAEFHFLMEEYYDIDPHYIMYGFPHKSLKDSTLLNYSFAGLLSIGISTKIDEDKLEKSMAEIFGKYYSPDDDY